MTEKSVTFTASPSGDCECFCFDITKEELERISPETLRSNLQDQEIDREFFEEIGREYEPPTMHRLYPNDILKILGVEYGDKRPITLKVTLLK